MTVFLWSLYNVNTRGIHTPNVIISMGLFVGGLVQFMAGMWEFPRGNVFGATSSFFCVPEYLRIVEIKLIILQSFRYMVASGCPMRYP